MADRYANFAELSKVEKIDFDYRILLRDLSTPIVVLAPHGGWIEPGSSNVATAIACEDHSLYLFEGIRRGRPHRDLHITSTRFDEPLATRLVSSAQTAIAIHGRGDGDDPRTVWLGGRNTSLGTAIAQSIGTAGFEVMVAERRLAGREALNICNRGTSGGGVQLELPRTLRDELLLDEFKLLLFRDAVREAMLASLWP
ncbi:poly-gamma-glutamate hydrolase family protein [Boseaceae bacterium BT-24-1]|nr:poly-gamma-glutamate hydrolase family protein [Boseaceae bacterium BT-24-1]